MSIIAAKSMSDRSQAAEVVTYTKIREFEVWVQKNLTNIKIFRDSERPEEDEKIVYRFEIKAEYFRLADFIQFKKSFKTKVYMSIISYDNCEFYQITFKPEVEASLKVLSKLSEDDHLYFKYRFLTSMCDLALNSPLLENVKAINPNSITGSAPEALIVARWREKFYWPWSVVEDYKFFVEIEPSDFSRQIQELKKFLRVCNGDT